METETSKPIDTTESNTPIITAPVTVRREKCPKRVAACKKLAAISRQAKEAKARRAFEAKGVEQSYTLPSINYGFLFGIIGCTAAIASIYYAKRSDDRQSVVFSPPPPIQRRKPIILESL